MREAGPFVIVLVSLPPGGKAEEIARSLVGSSLAACATRIPSARSVYRWKGEIHEDDEEILLVKTARALLERVETEIRRLHPYEVPEILALPVERGSEPYLRWLGSSLAETS